jgi:hypothetical protein
VAGHSHYWNVLDDGREVDLTLQQFDPCAQPVDVEKRDREYVLSFPDTLERYQRLREDVAQVLAGRS